MDKEFMKDSHASKRQAEKNLKKNQLKYCETVIPYPDNKYINELSTAHSEAKEKIRQAVVEDRAKQIQRFYRDYRNRRYSCNEFARIHNKKVHKTTLNDPDSVQL